MLKDLLPQCLVYISRKSQNADFARGKKEKEREMIFGGPNRWRRIGLMIEVHIA